MGLNHEKLTYRYAGRDFQLTSVNGNVVSAIMAQVPADKGNRQQGHVCEHHSQIGAGIFLPHRLLLHFYAAFC
ncbi:MAG: hypothetical protein JWO08_2128 [Verrucomicrobiaceae bacterium]|nr:hypothetical protein [Verrucomicrobiaceae bacterium]